MRRLFLLAFALLTWTSAAHADEAGRLSDRGRRMLSGTVGGSWYQDDDLPGLSSATRRWSIWAEPSFVYFVHDRVGLGGYVGYQNNHGDFRDDGIRYRENQLEGGFSGSFEAVASGAWGLFLNMNLGYSWTARTNRTSGEPGTDASLDHLRQYDRRVQLGFRLPLTYHLSPSLGIGLGPDLRFEFLNYSAHDFNDHPLRFRLGVSSWIAYSF